MRDPTMAAKLGWTPVAAQAIETGVPTLAHPVWDNLELSLRTGVSEPCWARKPPNKPWTPSPPTGNATSAGPGSGGRGKEGQGSEAVNFPIWGDALEAGR